MSCLKWGNLGTHGLVGGEQRRFADAAFLCPPPRSTPLVAWQAFAVERVNRKALPIGTSPLDVGWLCMLSCIREPSLRLAERIRRKER